MNIKKSLAFSNLLLVLITNHIYADNNDSYIDGSEPFIAIEDANREAEAWATCAATYDIMAELFGIETAQGKQLSQLANGAEVAVIMSIVLDDLNADMSSNQFEALWESAKLSGQTIPDIRMTSILADAEYLGSENLDKFLNRLAATNEVCLANIEQQQLYIDSWRELDRSGLLISPEE